GAGRAGARLAAERLPLPPGARPFPVERVFAFAIPAVGAVYLGVGLLVWALRRERRDAWALLVFCATMAAQLFISGPTTRTSTLLVWANMPLIGASSFFLFSVYPLEPPWFVRLPRLRALPPARRGAVPRPRRCAARVCARCPGPPPGSRPRWCTWNACSARRPASPPDSASISQWGSARP